jgi:TonB family protein
MEKILQLRDVTFKTFLVISLNIALFLILPLSQNFLKLFDEKKNTGNSEKRIIAEYIKPEKKEEIKKQQNRVRTVGSSESKSIQNPGKFKFSPDLSVGSGGEGVAIQGQELQAEVFEEGDVDVMPVPKYQPQPPYPEKARELAIEGEVKVEFVVDVNGKVSSIRSLSTPHQSFEKPVRDVISSWKFSPAVKSGVPVNMVMSIVIEYGLN